jgi:monooxygenase
MKMNYENNFQTNESINDEYQDIIIVGAGLSGIAAAYYLKRQCPHKSIRLLESRDRVGGTWDLFSYPGVRSDSDMYTFGFSFQPWSAQQSIADGNDIRDYIEKTAAEQDVLKSIDFGCQLITASWCSKSAHWTLTVQRSGREKTDTIRCCFLIFCTGCYDHKLGYKPQFTGESLFKGEIIHPQQWPNHLDYTGKHIVVIGSGATAITLVPTMAKTAAHVTMLQRSPSYIMSMPRKDPFAYLLRWVLPAFMVHHILRWKNALFYTISFGIARKFPRLARIFLKSHMSRAAGPDIDAKHLSPSYMPWDQRVLVTTDGELFKALREGRVSICTADVQEFTPQGVLTNTGELLKADIIVTATGFNMQYLGGVFVSIDGDEFNIGNSVLYRGCMLSGLPNAAMLFGYTNSSWTLKAEASMRFFCRMINYMDQQGLNTGTPTIDQSHVETEPFLEMTSGYIGRAAGHIPLQGRSYPWRLKQNYLYDLAVLQFGRINDGVLKFTKAEK